MSTMIPFWKRIVCGGPNLLDNVQIQRECLKILLNNIIDVSFTPYISKSTAIDGGNGVFVKGSVLKSQVVCLYPGLFYPPPPPSAFLSSDGEVCIKPMSLQHFKSNYLIHCSNHGGYLDGEGTTALTSLSALHSVSEQTKHLVSSFCVGHMINHPPKGIIPNIVPFDFLWRDVIQRYLDETAAKTDSSHSPAVSESYLHSVIASINRVGSGIWYVDPTSYEVRELSPHCAPLVGLAMVANREVRDGEELFMDYRFNPKERPDWYCPT